MKIKFSVTMKWTDYRLEYHNLKQTNNILGAHEIQKMWTPLVVFENTEEREGTKLSSDSEVEVRRLGNFSRSKIEDVEEINIFKGDENHLQWNENHAKSFKCVFKLEMYPFDVQVT